MSSGTQTREQISCWCSNTTLEKFSEDYARCTSCETLVFAKPFDRRKLLLVDDEKGFYGHQYYESYVTQQLGLPRIEERARTDLEDRCVYWLRTLLKYKLPPSRIVEVGSSHGGFVALMHWAGFDATGLELSPWLADIARETFDVPTRLGTIEQQAIEPQSLDAVVLMDVLEHLPDPAGTIEHCLSLLKPDGLVLIQCPEYPEDKTFEKMLAEHDEFIRYLNGPEHLHLFSKNSIQVLLGCVGASYLQFERAVFAPNDMFLVASRRPLSVSSREEIQRSLSTTVRKRLIRSLIGLDERLAEYKRLHSESEADRAQLRKHLHQPEEPHHDDVIVSQLNTAMQVLHRLEQSYVYRLMRKLGLWGWLARSIDRNSSDC